MSSNFREWIGASWSQWFEHLVPHPVLYVVLRGPYCVTHEKTYVSFSPSQGTFPAYSSRSSGEHIRNAIVLCLSTLLPRMRCYYPLASVIQRTDTDSVLALDGETCWWEWAWWEPSLISTSRRVNYKWVRDKIHSSSFFRLSIKNVVPSSTTRAVIEVLYNLPDHHLASSHMHPTLSAISQASRTVNPQACQVAICDLSLDCWIQSPDIFIRFTLILLGFNLELLSRAVLQARSGGGFIDLLYFDARRHSTNGSSDLSQLIAWTTLVTSSGSLVLYTSL